MTTVRDATPDDRDAIRRVYSLAFDDAEATAVAKLACDLLDHAATPPILSLVASVDKDDSQRVVAGHVAFSPVAFADGSGLRGAILAPLAVAPSRQRRGVGAQLVEAGFDRLRDEGVDVVLVYGDPAYYGRFGFDAATGERFAPPYPLEQPFGWQALPFDQDALPQRPIHFTCVPPLCDATLW